MNTINIRTYLLTENDVCDFSIRKNEFTLKFWGISLLFDGNLFSENVVKEKFKRSLKDIAPHLCGGLYT